MEQYQWLNKRLAPLQRHLYRQHLYSLYTWHLYSLYSSRAAFEPYEAPSKVAPIDAPQTGDEGEPPGDKRIRETTLLYSFVVGL